MCSSCQSPLLLFSIAFFHFYFHRSIFNLLVFYFTLCNTLKGRRLVLPVLMSTAPFASSLVIFHPETLRYIISSAFLVSSLYTQRCIPVFLPFVVAVLKYSVVGSWVFSFLHTQVFVILQYVVSFFYTMIHPAVPFAFLSCHTQVISFVILVLFLSYTLRFISYFNFCCIVSIAYKDASQCTLCLPSLPWTRYSLVGFSYVVCFVRSGKCIST